MGRFQNGNFGFPKNFKSTPWKADYNLNTRSFKQLPPELNMQIQNQRKQMFRNEQMDEAVQMDIMNQTRHPSDFGNRTYISGTRKHFEPYTRDEIRNELVEIGIDPKKAYQFAALLEDNAKFYRNRARGLDTNFMENIVQYKIPAVSKTEFRAGIKLLYSKMINRLGPRLNHGFFYSKVGRVPYYRKQILENQLRGGDYIDPFIEPI
jgi:hypothetical protein